MLLFFQGSIMPTYIFTYKSIVQLDSLLITNYKDMKLSTFNQGYARSIWFNCNTYIKRCIKIFIAFILYIHICVHIYIYIYIYIYMLLFMYLIHNVHNMYDVVHLSSQRQFLPPTDQFLFRGVNTAPGDCRSKTEHPTGAGR